MVGRAVTAPLACRFRLTHAAMASSRLWRSIAPLRACDGAVAAVAAGALAAAFEVFGCLGVLRRCGQSTVWGGSSGGAHLARARPLLLIRLAVLIGALVGHGRQHALDDVGGLLLVLELGWWLEKALEDLVRLARGATVVERVLPVR